MLNIIQVSYSNHLGDHLGGAIYKKNSQPYTSTWMLNIIQVSYSNHDPNPCDKICPIVHFSTILTFSMF